MQKLRNCELLPVKRTVKNQKVLSISNINVAGRFFASRHCYAEYADKIGVSGCAIDKSNPFLANHQVSAGSKCLSMPLTGRIRFSP